MGPPRLHSGKEFTGQWRRCKRCRFHPWEDPLEEEMAAHSSFLAWRIPWTEEPGRLYSPWGRKGLNTNERMNTHTRTRQCERF